MVSTGKFRRNMWVETYFLQPFINYNFISRVSRFGELVVYKIFNQRVRQEMSNSRDWFALICQLSIIQTWKYFYSREYRSESLTASAGLLSLTKCGYRTAIVVMYYKLGQMPRIIMSGEMPYIHKCLGIYSLKTYWLYNALK